MLFRRLTIVETVQNRPDGSGMAYFSAVVLSAVVFGSVLI